MDLDELLRGLDPQQCDAVTSLGAPLAIVAAAGSGKTTVLTRRIAYRIVNESAMGQHVLALTFTTQAATELRRRLRLLGLRDRFEAGTFHAVALRLLRQRAADQGLPTPSIAADRTRLMNEAIKELTIRADAYSALIEIDWCRARMIPVRSSATLSKRAGRREVLAPEQLSALADRYDLIKKRRGVIDFDDVLAQCLHALTTDRAWAAGVRWRFRHLFVDEAQDLNPLQHALLESLRDGRADLCLVGDPRQAIFGFNGSDPTIMTNVEKLYPGVTIVRLTANYRSTPQVLDSARRVLQAAKQHDDSRSMAQDGVPVRVVAHTDERAESAAVAGWLRDFTGSHGGWRSSAVLARTSAQLAELAPDLTRHGIPVGRAGEAAPRRALAQVLSEAHTQRNSHDLGQWIERINSEAEPGTIRARVGEAADRYLAQNTGISFRAWIELHAPFDDLLDTVSDDVVELLTLHAAKGREWRNVVIVGAESGLIPHSSAVTIEQKAEEARLLYVGCTRAREQLVLSWVGTRNGRASKASPLLMDVASVIVQPAAPPVSFRLPPTRPNPVYQELLTWRGNAARAAGVSPRTVCSDEALRIIAENRPTSVEALAAITDMGPLAANRLAPRLFAVLHGASGT